METEKTYAAFAGTRLLASGELEVVLRTAKRQVDAGKRDDLLVIEDASGRTIDFDWDGSIEDVIERAKPAPGRGRPKLGVVGREISLMPRHWEWLEEQPNGASAAIRRLVDEARKRDPGEIQARRAREAAHRFMTTMAGDRPGFEEALRSLFSKDRERFAQKIARWPGDIRRHAEKLAEPSFLAAEVEAEAEAEDAHAAVTDPS